MLLRHTKPEIKERQVLTINPAKTCQPIGAMYASLGIHNCLPHKPRLAGLLRLPPQHTDTALQGTGTERHQFIYGRCGGLGGQFEPGAGHR